MAQKVNPNLDLESMIDANTLSKICFVNLAQP
jgi:hypothetical protein